MPSKTVCLELELQIHFYGQEVYFQNYCELTVHANLPTLIGSMDRTLKIIDRPGVAGAVLQKALLLS